MERRFYLLDVFAEGQYSGNQLAVFRNASSLREDDMCRLAREVHFSETAFILSDEPREGRYDVRVFTPAHEIAFSGHAVLGAAWVLQRELIEEPVNVIGINLGVGPVDVSFVYHYGGVDSVWLTHRPPEFGEILQPEDVAPALGLPPADLEGRWPIREVSTGMPFVMVPLPSLETIRRACVIPDAYDTLRRLTTARALYLFAPETYNPDNDFNVRMFAPDHGIAEDPATGAGAGCLAAYALEHLHPTAGNIDLRIEQGYEVRRPSILFARAKRDEAGLRVFVGGRVAMVAQGHFV